MGEGLCEHNPIVGTNNPDPATKRDRALDDSELRAIWNACEGDRFGAVVKLLVLTGCRRNEIGDLRWSEVDFETGVVTIPGERTKSRRTLVLTLPKMALDILRTLPRQDGCPGPGRSRFDHYRECRRSSSVGECATLLIIVYVAYDAPGLRYQPRPSFELRLRGRV